LIAPVASWSLKYKVFPAPSTSALPTVGTSFTATVPDEGPEELPVGAAAPPYPPPPLHPASARAAKPRPAARGIQRRLEVRLNPMREATIITGSF
jgi:hypothetical protein